MGVGGIFRFIIRRIFEISVIVALLLVIPNLPPYTSISQPFSVTPPKPLEGKLALNELLNDVQIWHKGDFVGPEAFDDYNGELYTSIHGGDVVKLTVEHITPVVKFGKPCKGLYEERICGRPLGMKFDKDGNLYVADAYYGIFKVDVKTGTKQQIVDPKTKVGGRLPKLFNSVAVASNGDIYWTDSSTDFLLEDGVYTMLADPSGRLVRYDAKTKQNEVLLDNLHFANGVSLSDDEEFVIVAETMTSRIQRYYIKGPKKGSHDIFIDGLPGLPDNLKSDGRGGFLVPLVIARDEDHPAIYQSIGPFPLVRKALARLIGVPEFVIKKINEVFPSEFGAKAVHYIGHFSSTLPFFQSVRTTLLRVDRNGKITDSIHNLNKKIGGISEMHVFRDTLYLGSPFNDYIAKIPLSKIGWEDLKVERVKRAAPVETPKPTQAPKPTTTTPKPTTTTTPRPTTTTPKATTTTPRPTTTTPKPTTTSPPSTTTPPRPTTTTAPQKQQQAPPSVKQTPSPKQAPPAPKKQTPPPAKQQQQTTPPPVKQAPPKQQTTPPVKQQQAPPTKKETPPVQQQSQGQQRKQASPAKDQPKPSQDTPTKK